MSRFPGLLFVLLLVAVFEKGKVNAVERVPSGIQPKSGGVLRVSLVNDLSSLDPARCYDFPGSTFTREIYQSLVNYGEGAEILPELARSWTISSNGLEYTFVLDPRAHFSNGRTVVASDYVFSFERLLSPKMHCPGDFIYYGIRGVEEFRAGKAAHISGVEALAADRLMFTLSRPDLTFLFRLAMPFAGAICAEELKQTYRDIGTRSAGAGPFKLERWVHGAEIKLVRNPFYGGATPAFLDEIHVAIGVEQAVAQMMFERGELDIADVLFGVAGAEFPRIMRTPVLARNLDTEPSSTITYVALNTEIPPLDNKLVRQAMNYAVDKKRLSAIMGGRIIQIPGVLPPVMPGFQPNLQGYEYSPEKARRLLSQAGYPNGFTTTVLFANNVQDNFRIVAAVQEDLRQIGITLEATALSFPAYMEKSQRRRTAPLSLDAWSQDFPDPSNYLDSMLNGENISEQDCQNMAFYNNPRVNALLKEAATSLNPDERLRLYQQGEKTVVEDAPWIFLYAIRQYCLHQPWVKNTKPGIVWPFRFEKMWMDR